MRGRDANKIERRVTWIFGSPRSGSTWLLNMLREFESVVAINEPQIGFYLGPFACDSPGVHASDLDMGNFTLRRMQADYEDQFFSTLYRDAWGPSLRNMLNARFAAHVARSKPRLSLRKATVVVKEPNGSQSADVIMSAQPTARLMFLLRDGRDVVDSWVAAYEQGSWVSAHFPVRGFDGDDRLEFIVEMAHKWLWQTQVVEEAFAAHRGPKLLLRYEDLRADPSNGTREVLGLLELHIDDRELETIVSRHAFESVPESERGRDRFHRAATPGLWRENLTTTEIAAMHEVIGPKLRELGYDT